MNKGLIFGGSDLGVDCVFLIMNILWVLVLKIGWRKLNIDFW